MNDIEKYKKAVDILVRCGSAKYDLYRAIEKMGEGEKKK